MARDAGDNGAPRAPSQAERVYAGLREQLLRGDLPVGRRLVELQLAAEFETSRTPVREALRRLEGDGHIVRDPGGGLSPSAPSVKSMRELYEVRVAIEELVARRASTSGDREQLDVIERDWRSLETGWRTREVPRGKIVTARDILDYIQDPDYRERTWPVDYWPARDAVTDDAGWNATVKAIYDEVEGRDERLEFNIYISGRDEDLL